MSNEGVGGGSDPGLVPGGLGGGPAFEPPPFQPPSFQPPSFQPPEGGAPSAGIPPPPFPPPGFTAPPGDVASEPHSFQNGYWVAWNGQHWWNGSTWVPGPPPAVRSRYVSGSGGPGAAIAGIVSLVGFVIFAAILFSVCQSMPPTHGLGP